MDISAVVEFSCLINKVELKDRDIAIFHIIVEITEGNKGFVSNKLLIDKTKRCERTISDSIQSLQKVDLISVERIGGKNFIRCNLEGVFNK